MKALITLTVEEVEKQIQKYIEDRYLRDYRTENILICSNLDEEEYKFEFEVVDKEKD